MGTTANIKVKTKDKYYNYSVFMDDGYFTLGVFLLNTLKYKEHKFIDILEKDKDELVVADNYQEYIYDIDYEKSKVDIYYNQKNNNQKVIDYLKEERPDLIDLINIESQT